MATIIHTLVNTRLTSLVVLLYITILRKGLSLEHSKLTNTASVFKVLYISFSSLPISFLDCFPIPSQLSVNSYLLTID